MRTFQLINPTQIYTTSIFIKYFEIFSICIIEWMRPTDNAAVITTFGKPITFQSWTFRTWLLSLENSFQQGSIWKCVSFNFTELTMQVDSCSTFLHYLPAVDLLKYTAWFLICWCSFFLGVIRLYLLSTCHLLCRACKFHYFTTLALTFVFFLKKYFTELSCLSLETEWVQEGASVYTHKNPHITLCFCLL